MPELSFDDYNGNHLSDRHVIINSRIYRDRTYGAIVSIYDAGARIYFPGNTNG